MHFKEGISEMKISKVLAAAVLFLVALTFLPSCGEKKVTEQDKKEEIEKEIETGKSPYTLLREHVGTAPYQHIITLNSHGGWSDEFFKLPDNVFILVPDPKGFEQNYTLSNPSFSFEGIIFGMPNQIKAPKFSSGGWRLYQPGEQVRNLHLAPWDPEEYEKWSKLKSNKTIVAEIEEEYEGKVPPFYLVPSKYDSTKVKVFGKCVLQEVVKHLLDKKPDQPLLLMPFTCNAKGGNGDKPISALGKKDAEALLPLLDSLAAAAK